MKKALHESLTAVASDIDRYPWTDRDKYANWLAQTYWYVRHSTRLLCAAAARFGFDDAGEALHLRFGAHVSEEKRHELLALHDLKGLGQTLEAYPERALTRAFYETQYAKIERDGPGALLGYILLLEGLAIERGTWMVEQITPVFGNGVVSFLKVHAGDDPEHVQKALKVLDLLPENEQLSAKQNLLHTTALYRAMLADLARD